MTTIPKSCVTLTFGLRSRLPPPHRPLVVRVYSAAESINHVGPCHVPGPGPRGRWQFVGDSGRTSPLG